MKAQVEIGTVVDSLVLLRHLKAGAKMWELAIGDHMLPNGFKMLDLNRTIEELEAVKITAVEMCPQLRAC